MDQKPNIDAAATIDPAIGEKALKILRAIGRGNGLKEEDITILSLDGETLRTTANTIITLEPLVTKKTIPGRDTNGTAVDNPQALNIEVQKTSETVSKDQAAQQKIKDILLAREDKGFAIKSKKQKFHDLKKSFVHHYSCQPCGGNGKTACMPCRSTGSMGCSSCQGRRQKQCLSCHGSGSVTTQNNTQSTCVKCRGQGHALCTKCRGQGQVKCKTCSGQGRTRCQPCAASGWMSDSVLVEQEGLMMFHVNQKHFPEHLATMIEKDGQKMLMSGDLTCDLYEVNDEEKAQLKPSQIALGYTIAIPSGTISFQIKKMTVTSQILGYRGRLVNCPNFLETVVGKPLKKLVQAAKAPSAQTYAILEKACKARLIRDILQESAEHTQGGALKNLQKKYPYGIQEKTLRGMIKHTRKSFLDLTRAGRYKGFTLGLLVAGVISFAYYFGLRESVLSSLSGSTQIITTADIGAFIIGLIANLSLVQTIGKLELSKNLKKLLKKPLKIMVTQVKTGKAWIWSTIGNLVLFFAISWIAFSAEAISKLPAWLLFL